MMIKAMRIITAFVLTWCFSSSAGTAFAQDAAQSWSEDTANRAYYNYQANLPWKNHLGDWRDADGVAQGPKAIAEVHVADRDASRVEILDLTTMVREWLSGDRPNNGIMLQSNGGTIDFHSKESEDPSLHPKLVVEDNAGRQQVLAPTDDTNLHGSTHKLLGNQKILKVGRSLLKFDLSTLGDSSSIAKAVLQLQTTTRQYGSAVIKVYHPDPGLPGPPSTPETVLGLASKYPGDRGLESDPNVILFADFEAFDWASKWTKIDQDPTTTVPVDRAPKLKFQPLSGKAAQVSLLKGTSLGMGLLYKFAEELGYEPEEIFMRYYLRLADDWNPTLQGGKLPGIAGTYGRAGWGGRRSSGVNGWSMRGAFARVPEGGNPLQGLTPIGSYAYYADMPNYFGSNWWWNRDNLGLLERNQWYSIEQYVKMNTPGQNDGIMRAWIDGKLAFENNKVMYRTTDALKIDRIWMNVYHGGNKAAPEDYHLFIDNVVVAKEYIGPLATQGTQSQ